MLYCIKMAINAAEFLGIMLYRSRLLRDAAPDSSLRNLIYVYVVLCYAKAVRQALKFQRTHLRNAWLRGC